MNRLLTATLTGLLTIAWLTTSAALSQDRLQELPGYERSREVIKVLAEHRTAGQVFQIQWADDDAVYYTVSGTRYRFDLRDHTMREAESGEEPPRAESASRRGAPARGRQRDQEPSPDDQWLARCVDWNVVIEPRGKNSADVITVTTDGERKHRYGKASWVYGEELDQNDAMWWSPDSRRLAYYEFDERAVRDYYLTSGLTDQHTEVMIEGYPKAGEANPIARLWIYDLESDKHVEVDIGEDSETYIYNVGFTPDGSGLIFSRTNRWQNVLEVLVADPETGASRVILTETQRTWQENRPTMRFLENGQHFIWETERTGWKHLELRDLGGTLIATLTSGEYPIASIELVDEADGVLYYTAYSDEHPLNRHLHRVNLDGSGAVRLTHEPRYHTIDIAPDGQWFIARAEATDEPPITTLHDANGNRIAVLAEASFEPFAELGLELPELFTFKAADGETDLYGVLHKPTDFDPAKLYPLVIDVYGGPLVQRVRNTFNPANPACEHGFIIARIDNRGTPNRGKAFEDAIYLKLGETDLADQAAGVRFLTQRSYIDGSRVGIFGGSYGGYMSALAVLKEPDHFHVGVANAAVTDWRNYDTIYTERYMRTPQVNPEGYDAGSCVKLAENLRGRLLIQHGMVDDNVHPSNAFQLVDALQNAGKRFDLMMYPNRGHGLGGLAVTLRWEYLYQHLVAEPMDPTQTNSAEPVAAGAGSDDESS